MSNTDGISVGGIRMKKTVYLTMAAVVCAVALTGSHISFIYMIMSVSMLPSLQSRSISPWYFSSACRTFCSPSPSCPGLEDLPFATELPDSFDKEGMEEKVLCAIDCFNKKDYQSILDMGCTEFQEFLTAIRQEHTSDSTGQHQYRNCKMCNKKPFWQLSFSFFLLFFFPSCMKIKGKKTFLPLWEWKGIGCL